MPASKVPRPFSRAAQARWEMVLMTKSNPSDWLGEPQPTPRPLIIRIMEQPTGSPVLPLLWQGFTSMPTMAGERSGWPELATKSLQKN
jgi:hypothetical protein